MSGLTLSRLKTANVLSTRPGRGWRISVLTMVKIAALAPIPSASTPTATDVKPGVRRSRRRLWRKSWSIPLPVTGARPSRFTGDPERVALHLYFERHRGHVLVPHDRHLAAGVGHVGERPRQLIDGKRQRADRHRRAHDVLVGRVVVRAPDFSLVAGIVAGLRFPVRDDERPT